MRVRGVVIVLFLALINTAISRNKKWTFFVFAQQWPPSVCNIAAQEGYKCKSLPRQVETWTVHGLWPNKGNESVEKCNDNWHFNWNKIKSLEEQLKASWPNLLHKHADFTWLWRHEWITHGTCAASLEATNNEFRYFHKALSLNRLAAFNPQKALEKAGITPSCTKAYSVNAIQKAVMKYFRLDTGVKIMCAKDGHGRTLLIEIHMALSKTFNVTSMPGHFTSKCRPAEKIYIFPIDDIHCFQ